jgi:transposase
VIETAIDYKTLYEECSVEIVSLRNEIANLKRMIFGSKSESFILQNIPSAQLSLDIHPEAIATCSVIKAQKIE